MNENARVFCDLYKNIKKDLFRYAYYRLHSKVEAEDAVGDAVLDAWRQFDRLRDRRAFRAWMMKILSSSINHRIEKMIRERNKVRKMGHALEVEKKGVGDYAKTVENETDLEKALAILDDGAREVVLLSVVGELNSREVADLTGLTPGSVRSKLSRSLAKMRDFLEDKENVL